MVQFYVGVEDATNFHNYVDNRFKSQIDYYRCK